MKYVGKNGLKVGDNEVWHEGNFDPDDKQEKLGYTPVNKAGDIIDSSTSTHMKLRLHTEKATTDEFVGIAFGVDTSNKYMKSSIAHIRKGSNGQGDLVILLDGTASGKNVGLTDEKMRITKDGNVGIATNNPTQKLDVSGRIRMRTQTVASDGDDIVTTKKYVDDSIPTSLPANGGNADTVNGKTVAVNVPSDAKFTDTVTTINGKTGTITKADITALGIPAQDTVYTHPTSAGNKHIPAGGASGQFLKWSANGTATWDSVPGGLSLGETSGTAYRGDRGKVAYDHSQNAAVHIKTVTSATEPSNLNAGDQWHRTY